MKIRFLCMGATRNVSAAGQPATYNVDYQIQPDEKANIDVFGGVPFGVLTLRNLKKAPHGLEQSVTIELGGDGDHSGGGQHVNVTPAPPAPPAEQKQFSKRDNG